MATVLAKRKYPSAELSVEQRELIARLTVLLQAQGISRELFCVCLESAGYKVSKASLDRWVNSLASSGYALSAEGSPAARRGRARDSSGMGSRPERLEHSCQSQKLCRLLQDRLWGPAL